MGRMLVIGALLAGAYLLLDQNGSVRMSSGPSGGGFSTYSGASGAAINGIAGAAG